MTAYAFHNMRKARGGGMKSCFLACSPPRTTSQRFALLQDGFLSFSGFLSRLEIVRLPLESINLLRSVVI